MKNKFLLSFLLAIILLLIPLGFLTISPSLSFYIAVFSIYASFIIFILGLILKGLSYFKTPVEYNISLPVGQNYNNYHLKYKFLKAPFTKTQSLVKIVFEILSFRIFYRNRKTNKNLQYRRSVFLALTAFIFHLCLFLIFLGHLLYFWAKAPEFINYFNQNKLIIAFIFLGSILCFIFRRFKKPLFIISYFGDFFILLLILNVVLSGLCLYFFKENSLELKASFWSLLKFNKNISLNKYFGWHLVEASFLIGLIPFTKLKHFFSIFLMPTLNKPNNARAIKHKNPNNPEVKTKNYNEYLKL